MHDDGRALDLLRGKHPRLVSPLDGLRAPSAGLAGEETACDCCPAFGYLRGIRDQAVSLELRFRSGNTENFPYSWLGPISFNPSAGILLKFSGDVIYLVLVRGSNLDAVLPGREINLTDRGLFRHRIVWIREMEEEELKKGGTTEPTIDEIKIGEFESQEELRGYLKKVAPVFLSGRAAGGSG